MELTKPKQGGFTTLLRDEEIRSGLYEVLLGLALVGGSAITLYHMRSGSPLAIAERGGLCCVTAVGTAATAVGVSRVTKRARQLLRR
jgi:hypothetical protein